MAVKKDTLSLNIDRLVLRGVRAPTANLHAEIAREIERLVARGGIPATPPGQRARKAVQSAEPAQSLATQVARAVYAQLHGKANNTPDNSR
jgi:hypothetical protein